MDKSRLTSTSNQPRSFLFLTMSFYSDPILLWRIEQELQNPPRITKTTIILTVKKNYLDVSLY